MASAPGSQLTRRLAGTVAEACDRMFDPTPGGGSHPLEALVEKVRDGASRNMGAAGHVLDGGHAVRSAPNPVAPPRVRQIAPMDWSSCPDWECLTTYGVGHASGRNGGGGGIRTHGPRLEGHGLANRCLGPLGHPSRLYPNAPCGGLQGWWRRPSSSRANLFSFR